VFTAVKRREPAEAGLSREPLARESFGIYARGFGAAFDFL
jgi:hypothetical protein